MGRHYYKRHFLHTAVFISNDRGRSLFEAFDWLFICVDPSDVRDLRVNVVVEIGTP